MAGSLGKGGLHLGDLAGKVRDDTHQSSLIGYHRKAIYLALLLCSSRGMLLAGSARKKKSE